MGSVLMRPYRVQGGGRTDAREEIESPLAPLSLLRERGARGEGRLTLSPTEQSCSIPFPHVVHADEGENARRNYPPPRT